MQYEELERDESLKERWEAVENPGCHLTQQAFSRFLKLVEPKPTVLNAAIPLKRALSITNCSLPKGLTIQDCLTASVIGGFPDALKEWEYEPHIRSVPQLPQMVGIPSQYGSLIRLPWFQSPGQAVWLGLNARHLRYHYRLWCQMKPKVIQGVTTTMVVVMPQIGFALSPHIQTEKSFLFLGALGRGLAPVQLFPARYIYPDADLDGLGEAPAPIFADLLPLTGGFAFPVVDCEPDPWRTLAKLGQSDRFYGYPFHLERDPMKDFSSQGVERGVMLLPNGKRVSARHTKSFVHATLDRTLGKELLMDRDHFEDANCLLRGTVTHDGLPYQLPVEMQCMVHTIVLTHWTMELDKAGDLNSYSVITEHAAIRGFNFFQRIEPYYSKFMSLIQQLSKNPDFKTYPLSTHLTDSWLGGNLLISNKLSESEEELGPAVMRAYYRQQLDWMAGVTNLMNTVAFRGKKSPSGMTACKSTEIEQKLGFDGLALHQMRRLLRFDSRLFKQLPVQPSPWPNLHPGWTELDKKVLTESLPKL